MVMIQIQLVVLNVRKVAEAFNMDPERYVPVMIVSIGKAKNSGYQSYRLPITDVTTFA